MVARSNVRYFTAAEDESSLGNGVAKRRDRLCADDATHCADAHPIVRDGQDEASSRIEPK
jgi:hypothetical protein